ncbi:MAG: hypothetical protein KC910_03250 [Candidatus Eremiobacteraeota bacterium]|nr:hypothetical protein [Candidatus Eremiobacteraeota bacterium]
MAEINGADPDLALAVRLQVSWSERNQPHTAIADSYISRVRPELHPARGMLAAAGALAAL